MNSKKYNKSYYVNLKDSWEEHYNKTVKSKIRADSRRQRRRLSNLGKTNFICGTNEIEKRKIIELMILQKSIEIILFRYFY